MTYGILPNGKQQFIDSNGKPLASGKVYYYIPSTTTFKNTYQNSAGTVLNTNPVVLDANGQCIAYGTGSYRQQVYDVYGNLVWDVQVDSPLTSGNQTYDIEEQTFTATSGQTVFTLTTMSYVPGTNNLVVFVDGLKQIVGVNYTETSATVVTFTTGLHVGAVVDFTTAVLQTNANIVPATDVTYNEGGTGAVTTTVQAKLQQTISVKDFGATGNGSTDDTTAINNTFTAAASTKATVFFPPGIYITSSTINQPDGVIAQGSGGGGYTALTGASDGSTIIQSSVSTAAWTMGAGCVLQDVQLRPSNYSSVSYSAGNYPSGTGNTAYGVKCGTSAMLCRVVVIAFSTAGFYITGATVKLDNCFAFNNAIGLTSAGGNDGWATDCVFMFNSGSAGVDATYMSYWRWTSNRIEWNARYGLIAGAENSGANNLFDRNGWAGLYLNDGAWGQTWTGNYFSRNGAGGDPSQGYGRWGFSTPSDPSWVTTSAADSCQIKFGYQRGITIVGNRYRAGQSDTNDGANSPCYIYQVDGTNGATDVSDVRIAYNAGDQQDVVKGYNPAAYGGIGAIAIGNTDTSMSGYLSNGFGIGPTIQQTNLLNSQLLSTTSSSSIVINVPKGSCGQLSLSLKPGTGSGVATIYWSQSGVPGTYMTAAYTNNIGTYVTGVSFATNTSIYDKVTITLSSACYYSYCGVSA